MGTMGTARRVSEMQVLDSLRAVRRDVAGLASDPKAKFLGYQAALFRLGGLLDDLYREIVEIEDRLQRLKERAGE